MKRKEKFFIVHSCTFKADVVITYAEPYEIFQWLNRHSDYPLAEECEKDFVFGPTTEARAVLLESGVIILRFRSRRPPLPVFCHELLHAVFMILGRRGLQLTTDSEEAYTYLFEELMEKALLFRGGK